MSAESFKRKLTAILSADVKGYSRLMGEDEAETVRTLTSYRKIMSELIQQHRGRVIDSPGDNILAEFGSVVDAVQCSVAAQNEFKARNAELPENRRMVFRIGVNLGDVIEEEGRIYGDGVNIAARLEALADPGGICISKTAFDHIESKLPLGYQFLGDQTVKNIAKPVGAYKVLMEPRVLPVEEKKRAKEVTFWKRKSVLAGSAALLVVILGVAVWNFYWRAPKIEPASKEKMALPLPDMPSIAVLPFVNMSDDPKQEFLCDGMTEDIITALSKVPRLFVIARNSTFTYKGKPVKVKQVSEELGVRYVLEGSVQRSGDRIRITAQLIDALTGNHLWAERYDRGLKDLFALQDEITMKILTATRVKLTEGEHASSAEKYYRGRQGLDCYLKLTEANGIRQRWNIEDNNLARRMVEEAIGMCPENPMGYVSLGWVYHYDYSLGNTKSPRETVEKGIELVQKALAMDDSIPSAHVILCYLYLDKGDNDKAMAEAERAMALNPGDWTTLNTYANSLRAIGKTEEAIPFYQKAIRLTPFGASVLYRDFGRALRDTRRFEEAVSAYKKAIQLSPNDITAHIALAITYSIMGRENEARSEGAEVLRIDPKFSAERFLKNIPPGVRKDNTTEALRKAGLLDKPPLPLPDKPSIAVLPFVNMSDDKSQEYFSDGLTEEIITALSKTPKLFVIARNSTFVYKGKPVNVQQVSRELGVKYVLEGSIRKSGDQLRITVQLIDATTGNHLWAERYDPEIKDIFAIQDEITMKVIKALQLNLTEGEQAIIYGRGTNNLEAYLKFLQGVEYQRRHNPDDNQKAKRILEEAIALDPNYAVAYRLLGATHMVDVWLGTTAAPRESLLKAAELSRKAIALDESLGTGHAMLGHIYILMRDYDKGIEEGQKAVELEPNGADSHAYLGMGLQFADRPEEAIKILKKAVRLNPVPPGWYLHNLAVAYRNMGRYDEAIEWGKEAVDREPSDLLSHVVLVSSYSLAGREEEAQAEAAQVLRLNPRFSLERLEKTTPQKNPEVKRRFIDSLRKAGLK